MKLQFRQIDAFVKSPPKTVRAILLYGPDQGLMRERAATIGRTVVADLHDPFNVSVLQGDALKDDPARLQDEARAISMMGGDRLVRIEGAVDANAPLLKSYLADAPASALVLLEAGDLGKNSPLRLLFEKAENAAALPCYVEEARDLGGLIRDTLRGAGFGVDGDAVQWLGAAVVGDRARVRSEIEKLILYMGPQQTGQTVRLADVVACCGDTGAVGFDDLVVAVASGRMETALATWSQLTREDIPSIAILRALQSHFRRLHLAQAHLQSGATMLEAMKRLNPPVFFKQEDSFQAQLRQWSMGALERVLMRLSDLEAKCKRTGTPDETLTAQTLISICLGVGRRGDAA